MTLVLRKSVGPFSAGTRVRMIAQHKDIAEVEGTYYKTTRVDGNKRLIKIDEAFGIPMDYLVELRNRTDNVPAVSRSNRDDRRAKRKLYELKGQPHG